MISVKYLAQHRDYVIHGLNNNRNFNVPKYLRIDSSELLEEFKRMIGIRIIIWKEVYATDKGAAAIRKYYEDKHTDLTHLPSYYYTMQDRSNGPTKGLFQYSEPKNKCVDLIIKTLSLNPDEFHISKKLM